MKFNSLTTLIFSFTLIFNSLIMIFLSFYFLSEGEMILEWEASSINSTKLIMLVVLDFMSLFFFSLVSLISGSVMWFSSSYMSGDKFYSRFILLVISFVMSMSLLIFSPNLISLLLGWDGLGVTSYLLVIFYQSEKSFNAGMITALTNRLGDVAILISIGLLLSLGSWSYIYYNVINNFNYSVVIFILVVASMTKSAQIPFSAWLPAAMAAPTPVSALVHSSTLVTAGVYLLIRLNYLIFFSGATKWILLLGGMTTTMAGMAALKELDMKKVIALSTLSQLGMMFFALGLALPGVSFFHLVSHAYFKAMLFMAAGSVIHSMNDYQDIRMMGFGVSMMPVSLSIIMVASMSLSGLPFMSGFYSKDLILEMMLMSSFNIFIFLMMMLATALTVLYSLRFVYLVFMTKNEGSSNVNLAEMDFTMMGGMMMLIIPSILGGMAISWSLMSFDSLVFLPLWLKLFILTMIVTLVIISINMSSDYFMESKKSFMGEFIEFMWFMPLMFSTQLLKVNLNFSKNIFKISDQSWNLFLSYMLLSNFFSEMSGLKQQLFKSNFLKSVMMILIMLMII